MSRATRVECSGAIYHVMSRGFARMPVFLSDRDRADFLEPGRRTVEDGRLVVHAFCFMSNQYHLLCETPGGGLRTLIREINGGCARRFNRAHRCRGHLRQGRYRAILVEDFPHFLECSRSIHLNSNRSRRTRPAERYRWSSSRSCSGSLRQTSMAFLTSMLVSRLRFTQSQSFLLLIPRVNPDSLTAGTGQAVLRLVLAQHGVARRVLELLVAVSALINIDRSPTGRAR